MSTFWSAWIIILTTLTILATSWLLFANRKTKNANKDNTTGHVYDGIEEYDNPLPAWWLYLFVISIVFGIGYLIAYPGMGNFPGMLNWTKEKQLQQQIDQAEKQYGEIFAQYSTVPVEELIKDRKALKMGRRMFANNCAQCHGSGGHGAFGFPNLSDNDWLYGGSPDKIKQSITEGRTGAMPSWKPVLGDDGIKAVTQYVLSLSGAEHDPQLAAAGEAKYQMFCVACHGANGDGNPLLGAPRLNDGIWLYGGSEQEISYTISVGRNGHMPAHSQILKSDKIHLLTAYVYSLSR